MPIYEYECNGCGFKLEKLTKLATEQSVIIECPKCAEEMKLKVSPFNFTFADTRKSKVNPNARQVRG